MRIMIHACPKRMWYVEGYLVPKLVEQGIPKKSIVVWNDETGKGNLISCIEAFKWCGEHPVKDGTWHLQDDVVPAADFAKRAKGHKESVVCGFSSVSAAGRRRRGRSAQIGGIVKPDRMWWSFPCIRIEDALASDCAKWVDSEESDEDYREKKAAGEDDDFFFRIFMLRYHPDMDVMNVSPNLVNHIAEMIGGSVLGHEGRVVSSCFEDHGEWQEAEDWIRDNGV